MVKGGALWVLLTPIVLFVILMILLYVPPVQNFIRKQATAIASDATGMNISVERIDLRFPLNLLCAWRTGGAVRGGCR